MDIAGGNGNYITDVRLYWRDIIQHIGSVPHLAGSTIAPGPDGTVRLQHYSSQFPSGHGLHPVCPQGGGGRRGAIGICPVTQLIVSVVTP